jgi:hypothetical protein
MQPSLQNQLLTLTHKVETGLEAIDQLSQLLMLLITELRNPNQVREPHRSGAETLFLEPETLLPETLLPENLLVKLSNIRQFLMQSSLSTEGVSQTSGIVSTAVIPVDLRDNQLVGDHEVFSLHHKDVIEDKDSLEIHDRCGDSLVSPDMQLRRLMAQLTAAYNRIAALEEQLLSQRPSYKQEA